jgi:hypothetical protein
MLILYGVPLTSCFGLALQMIYKANIIEVSPLPKDHTVKMWSYMSTSLNLALHGGRSPDPVYMSLTLIGSNRLFLVPL